MSHHTDNFWLSLKIRGFIPTNIVVDANGDFWERNKASNEYFLDRDMQKLNTYELQKSMIKSRYAYINRLISSRANVPVITDMLVQFDISRNIENIDIDGKIATVKTAHNSEEHHIRIFGVENGLVIGFFESNVADMNPEIWMNLVAFTPCRIRTLFQIF